MFTQGADGKTNKNYYSAENIGANLAESADKFVKKGGQVQQLSEITFAPNDWASRSNNSSGEFVNRSITSFARHLYDKKEALKQFCDVFKIQYTGGADDIYNLSNAMQEANGGANGDNVLTRQEVASYLGYPAVVKEEKPCSCPSTQCNEREQAFNPFA